MPQIKTAFVYWGAQPHPRRELCAQSIDADFYQLTFSKFHPFGEMVQATNLARKLAKKNYDVILVDSIISMECAYAYKTFFRGTAKIIMYVVDPTFHVPTLGEGIRKKFYLTLSNKVDGFLVPSLMNKKAVAHFYPHHPIGYATAFLYRGSHAFDAINPQLKNKAMVFIGSARVEKNVEGTVGGYLLAHKKKQVPDLYMLGAGTDTYLQDNNVECATLHGIGKSKIEKYLEKSTFLIHPAYFDSAPCVIIEAMAAGVIPVVSTGCGNYDIVEAIDKRLIITDLSSEGIAQKIEEIQAFSDKDIAALSKKARTHSRQFSKEEGIKAFKNAFKEVYNQIK